MPEPTQKDINKAEELMFDVELDADGDATRVLRAHTIDEFVQEIAQAIAQAREEGRKEAAGDDITPCPHCCSMTHTGLTGLCGKCGEYKFKEIDAARSIRDNVILALGLNYEPTSERDAMRHQAVLRMVDNVVKAARAVRQTTNEQPR